MTQVLVQRPSFRRYWHLFRDGAPHSILRCLEYERLAALALTGRVLDLGGGSRTNYAAQVARWGQVGVGYTYESANIDPKTAPTYLIEPDAPLPVQSDCYDAVLSFNTFEHIYDLAGVLSEIRRVLKPGGRLIFVVPFIFRVHGHPDDYSRGTASFWLRRLAEHGFVGTAVEALTWGPFSTAQTVSGLPGPFKALRRHAALLLDIAHAKRRGDSGQTVTVVQDAPLCAAPLAYFIQTAKP